MSAQILIIEDNPDNLELMSYLLNAFGYSLMSATNGSAGLEQARQTEPDLIVCDIQLPQLSGLEVIRQLKADSRLRTIPVVGVTAFAMVGDRDRILAAGFDDYIAKPIDPETFVAKIAARLKSPNQSGCSAVDAGDTAAPAQEFSSGPEILVVDNWPDNLALARSIFEPSGYVVRTANCPGTALAALRERPCDLILSDICMGEESGFDLIQSVKAEPKWRRIPFVFLTSTFVQESDRRVGMSLGADEFLRRPIEPEILLREIAACLVKKA